MDPTPDRIKIIPDVLGAFNIAAQQNRISFIRGVKIQNPTETPLSTVVLNIRSEPAFMREFTLTVDYIPAGREFSTGSVSPDINFGMLAELTERIDATLYFELKQDETLLASETATLPLLAYDEWQGSAVLPELLCAFVTPNHPKLSAIIGKASELLGKWTGSPSLDAYQSKNPDRVLAEAAAIYGAIQELNIVYAVAPAHFESIGQRIRLCDNVIDAKLGNCVELSLLYAACLEAVGLSPILCVTDDHVFAGVWLIDTTFPETVVYDPSLVSKRLASGVNELAVVECTAMCAGKANDFNSAMAIAAVTAASDKVRMILDVRRARMSKIRPIAQRFGVDGSWSSALQSRDESEITGAPAKLGETVDLRYVTPDEFSQTEAANDRLSLWKRKLLDLGLRNSLINLRQTKGIVPLLVSSVPTLEDRLADGVDFGILTCPKEFERPENLSQFEYSTKAAPISELLDSEAKNARLRSTLTEGELARSMTELYRAARLSIEENGANTLYISLGMLRWYETPAANKPRYAPLLLIPVEIVHKSSLRGYIIRRRDEDAQLNSTLLEMLRQDFGITVSLPELISFDEHGVDVHSLFTMIRRAVMELPRWDVVETAALGIFSFSQFVMWNDLVNRIDDIKKNKIVSSLIDGKLSWQAEPMTIGDRVPEDGVYLPMSADASQLYAVERAAAGDSFVLHGPPGTGKSQTITLLIANALAKGKTILFVAEKLAALQVVEKRLDSLGIGAFCLELHSNKSRKRDLLDQLREAAEAKRAQPDDHWQKVADSAAEKRHELDAYVDSLHAKRRSGMSLYELVGEYERLNAELETIRLDSGFADMCDADTLAGIKETVRSIVSMARATGQPAGHPLLRIRAANFDAELRDNTPRLFGEYRSLLASFADAAHSFSERVCESATSYDDWRELREVAGLLGFWQTVPRQWAECADISTLTGQIHRLCAHANKAREIKSKLSDFRESIYLLDAKSLYNDWNRASADWLLPKLLGQSKVIKQLALHSDKKPDKARIPELLGLLISYHSENDSMKALAEKLADRLGSLYVEDEDCARLDELAYEAEGNASQLAKLGADDIRTGRLTDEVVSSAKRFCEQFDKMTAKKRELYTLLEIDECDGDFIEDEQTFCDKAMPELSELKLWCGLNRLRDRAISLGIGEIVDAYEGRGREPIEIDRLEAVTNKSVLKSLIEYTIDTDSLLCEFTGALFNDKINRFKELSERLESLARTEIYARIASRLPDLSREASQSSEVGILQRAIRSGGRGVSIRRLFSQLPNLLPRLCPCMLMSPISAAQYLDPKRKPFDIVVFDEASQLPTCKAVGVIARGESAIIVGDPKQMPPTSFFGQNNSDEDAAETDDLESILDDCLALNLPETHLTWHYRSMHESLIAFSNSRFYENRLYTFPSVNDRESMVKAIHVDGIFDRGRTRTNRAEAEAVVAELKRRASDPKLSQRSVGVVTFNISQQNLIEDLLDDACAADEHFDDWVNNRDEAVFVKNLENVQGDERDVILFSVAFAPDRDGSFYMNFGPLNRDGGWRRLNVAVSRAKYEMVVFTSIAPEAIDLARTSSEGVAALRAFLEYADGRPLPETAATANSAGRGGLAERIAVRLEERGYKTQCAVGHSAYRVDIAVVDPDDPSRYILGIMLDGESYASAKTTRDREISQISVLRRLGWTIHRVWTLDWWENPDRELERVIEAIDLAKTAKRENQVTAESAAADSSYSASDTDSQLNANAAAENAGAQYRLESAANTAVAARPLNCLTTPYKRAQPDACCISSDDFQLESKLPALREVILSVIETEAPIYEQLLNRRVTQTCGISRAGARIQGYLVSVYSSMGLKSTTDSGGRLYWRQDQSPEEYREIRAGGDERREIEQIPDCELEGAVRAILALEVGLPRDDLIREAAKLLGFSRLGSNVTGRVDDAISRLAGRGKIVIDDNGGCALADSDI